MSMRTERGSAMHTARQEIMRIHFSLALQNLKCILKNVSGAKWVRGRVAEDAVLEIDQEHSEDMVSWAVWILFSG